MEAYQQLEERWAQLYSLDPMGMVACASGTAALHLSLEALQLHPGKIVTGNFNMIAVPRAIVMSGHQPAFIDCRDDLNMNPKLLWSYLEDSPDGGYRSDVEGIIAVHIYGRSCDLGSIGDAAKAVGIPLIEDMAELHGQPPSENTEAACWSFYKNKVFHGEEGGAVWFRDNKKAELARSLRCLGFTPKHDFIHIPRGHNYRMSNLHAKAVLECIDNFNYLPRIRLLEKMQECCPEIWRQPTRQSLWVYDIRIPQILYTTQNKIIQALKEKGIAARHSFKAMSLQHEFLIKCDVWGNKETVKASQEVIYLPLDGSLPEERIPEAFGIIKSCLSH